MGSVPRDDQRERIKDWLPGKATDRGVAAKDNRLFVEAVPWVARIHAGGAQAVIPPRRNRTEQRSHDQHWYQDRNLVERFFSRLKQFRRIATRHEKLARNFMSMLNLACACIWLA